MRSSTRPKRISVWTGMTVALSMSLSLSSAPTALAQQSEPTATPVVGAHVLAAARSRLPSLRVTRHPRKLTVSGRTGKKSSRLVLQRAAAGSSRWVRVKRIVSRKHTFRTRVARRRTTTRYRIRIPRSGRASVARIVRAVKPPVKVAVQRDACGVRPKKANGSLWSCTFVDNFGGTELDRQKWVPQTQGYRTGTPDKFACYTEDNVAVQDGALRLRLQKRKKLFECLGKGLLGLLTPYTAGSVTTYHQFSQRYGRFEARTRNTAADVAGLHEAFWLWPDDREVKLNWPWTGEIDVAETYSVFPHLAIPFLHYSNDVNGNVWKGKHANTALCSAERGTWNTYRLQWSASRIRVFVNNKLCLTNTSGDSAFRERYILAFTQGIGAKGNEVNQETPMPAFTEVDWVRVWE